jgi:hypothetical protein
LPPGFCLARGLGRPGFFRAGRIAPFVGVPIVLSAAAVATAASAVAAMAMPAVPEHVHGEHRAYEQDPQPIALQPFHLDTPLSSAAGVDAIANRISPKDA